MRRARTILAFVAIAVAAVAVPRAGALIAGAAERLQFADGLYKRGMYELAAKEYEALLTAAVKAEIADVALFRLGESYRFLGQSARAIDTYARLLETYPDSLFADRAAFRRAELAFQNEDYETAGTWFEALLARKPSDDIAASANYYRGLSFRRRGLDKEAEQSFRTVIDDYERSPFASYAAMALADLLVTRDGSARRIRPLYRRVAERPETTSQGAEALARWLDLEWGEGNYDDVLELYDRMVETYPADPRTRTASQRAALASLYRNEPGRALALATNGLASAAASDRPSWQYILANAYRMSGEVAAATPVYEDLLKAAEGETRRAAAIELASIYSEQGKHASVLTVLGPLDDAGVRAADRTWMLALAYAGTGRLADAERLFTGLLDDPALTNRHAAALFELARVAQRSERWEDMAVRYERFAREYAGHELAPLALEYAGAAARKLGQDGRARLLWESLLASYPEADNRDAVLFELAGVRADLEDAAAARDALEQLLRDFPRGAYAARAHFLRGQLLEQEDQFEVADYHYQAALRLEPGDPLATRLRFRRIAVLQRLGRGDEAADMLKTLLAADPAPEIPEPMVDWLARWNLEQERYADAIQAAVHLAGASDDPAWQQIGWFLAGTARYRDGLLDDAAVSLERAIGIEIESRERLEAALTLGRVRDAQGRLEEAEAAYRRAADLVTRDDDLDIKADAYLALAKLYRANGDWEETSRFAMSVAVLFDDPERSPEALHLAAEAFGKLDREQDRRSALEELTSRYPGHPLAGEAGQAVSQPATGTAPEEEP